MAVLAILLAVFILPTFVWIKRAAPTALPLSGPFQLRMLVWATLLSLLLPILQIGLHIRRFGGSAIRGNRDFYPTPTGVAARIARAHGNSIESFAPFAAAILSAHALDIANRWTIAGAALFPVARLLHAISYLLGVTILRSAAFYAAWLATAAVAINCLFPAR